MCSWKPTENVDYYNIIIQFPVITFFTLVTLHRKLTWFLFVSHGTLIPPSLFKLRDKIVLLKLSGKTVNTNGSRSTDEICMKKAGNKWPSKHSFLYEKVNLMSVSLTSACVCVCQCVCVGGGISPSSPRDSVCVHNGFLKSVSQTPPLIHFTVKRKLLQRCINVTNIVNP